MAGRIGIRSKTSNMVPARQDPTFIPLSPTQINGVKFPQAKVHVENVVTPPAEANGFFPETSRLPPSQSKYGTEQYKYSSPYISERAIDQPRPLKVVYIGAVVSGILATIKFRAAVPNIDLVIYEKNPESGGPWYENRYPGCACARSDVPSHSYQLSFEPWTEWSHFFSCVPEILEYWKQVAHKYDGRKHSKFQSRCPVERPNREVVCTDSETQTGEVFEDSANVFMTGTGLLNERKWPEIPESQSFKGQLLHSANWDENFDSEHVAVIGAGSSGIQIVPALVDKVKAMGHYVRGRTWISSQHRGDELTNRTQTKGGNFEYTEEEKQAWRRDPNSYIKYRKELEFEMQSLYPRLTSPRLPSSVQTSHSRSRFFGTLASPKFNVISTAIASVNETGVITADGDHHPMDAIICATGFETSPDGGCPIICRHGVKLRQRYAQRPETYLGLCTDGFPNFFQSSGTNAFQGAGNLLIMMEQIHVYVSLVLSCMAYDNIGRVEPKRSQVENFTNLTEKYFERTVYSAECASWYKSSPPGATMKERKNGRVTALWPGSSLHAVKALSRVRWGNFQTNTYDGNDF
ncbi:hypothetical protein AJ79_06791 [Helicocarpus griseus UAMH5409]|uniref:FAD/NAD(P)-binding domain-containing protein n=1 Tax=Helicocarpus griseus UAMH5409 TaxID=1447875 RepID=A0A2B7X1I6_9EURO|nr:hypothetical protein AJ79_06791 [Helicocarpus griseus UAMH5409]